MPKTPADERRDVELLQRAAAGDRDAFAALYEAHRTAVYRFARLMSGSNATAEDVTQEVFVTLIGTLSRYEPRRADLGTYLYGIARNVTRNRLRRDRRFVALDPVAETPSPADDPCSSAFRAQQIDRLRRAIVGLPSRYREAVILCDIHGLSYLRAARALDVPIGTVRSRLSRGRQLITSQLHDERAAPGEMSARVRCIV